MTTSTSTVAAAVAAAAAHPPETTLRCWGWRSNLVIYWENTEGFYADRNTFRGTGEFMPTPDMAIAHGIITRQATERIAREAFMAAGRRPARHPDYRAQGQRALVPRSLPTVDMQALAGHETSALEIEDSVHDVLDLTQPSERVQRCHSSV